MTIYIRWCLLQVASSVRRQMKVIISFPHDGFCQPRQTGLHLTWCHFQNVFITAFFCHLMHFSVKSLALGSCNVLLLNIFKIVLSLRYCNCNSSLRNKVFTIVSKWSPFVLWCNGWETAWFVSKTDDMYPLSLKWHLITLTFGSMYIVDNSD